MNQLKIKVTRFEWKLHLEDVDSYLDISFLNFQT